MSSACPREAWIMSGNRCCSYKAAEKVNGLNFLEPPADKLPAVFGGDFGLFTRTLRLDTVCKKSLNACPSL